MTLLKTSKNLNRIMDIKYLRLLWLDKGIKELKLKIKLYKLSHLVLVILLSGCATALPRPSLPMIYTLSEDECILQAFIKEDPIFEKEKIYNSLLTFRKIAPKGTIHYFFWYLNKTYLQYMKNEWWIKRSYKRILANYRYYKLTNERLSEVSINPLELLRKVILNEK